MNLTSLMRWAGAVCGGLAGVGLVLLHFLKPEYEPSWRLVSEYAIGDFGWVMRAVFWLLAVAYVAVVVRAGELEQSRAVRAGRILLALAVVGLVVGGIFTADPITTPEAELTTVGTVHDLAAMVAILGTPVAAGLLTFGKPLPWPVKALAACCVLGFAAFVVVLAVSFRGEYGPDVLAGWPNRFSIAAYLGWATAFCLAGSSRRTGV